MPHQLTIHSPDLMRLKNDGYEITIVGGYLVMTNVPYLSNDCVVLWGTLISVLNLQGDKIGAPGDHVAYFIGRQPHDEKGTPLKGFSLVNQDLGDGLTVNFMVSWRPIAGKYIDYYEKMSVYVETISRPVRKVDPDATARTFAIVETEAGHSVFNYLDTASSRAGIGRVTERLKVGPIAIVGLGGSGSYILDLVAKTPVAEIHLFDGDIFGQHNAFRAPGAPTGEVLRESLSKSVYFRRIYSAMHRGIFAHESIDDANVKLLESMEFVFIAVDDAATRKLLADVLGAWGKPFIDVGMGLWREEDSLDGILRVTFSADSCRTDAYSRLPVEESQRERLYASNIQVADLNALNGTLAVIRWKKFAGFYVDRRGEYSIEHVISLGSSNYRSIEEQ